MIRLTELCLLTVPHELDSGVSACAVHQHLHVGQHSLVVTQYHQAACFVSDMKRLLQVNVDANVARQNELLVVIKKETAAYRQAFGFREWRQACEVGIFRKNYNLGFGSTIRADVQLNFVKAMQRSTMVESLWNASTLALPGLICTVMAVSVACRGILSSHQTTYVWCICA